MTGASAAYRSPGTAAPLDNGEIASSRQTIQLLRLRMARSVTWLRIQVAGQMAPGGVCRVGVQAPVVALVRGVRRG